MEELELIDARVSLNLCINKMMFRLKLATLSDKQREGVETIITDMHSASNTLKKLEKEWRVARQRNCDLELIYLQMNQQVKEVQAKSKQESDNFDEMQALIKENEELKKQLKELKELL